MTTRRTRRAFALPDVLAAALAAALVLCILLTRAPHSRHLSAQSDSLANLRNLASITGTYQSDYNDRMWGLSWTPQQHGTSQYPDVMAQIGFGNHSAASAQAVDIIRRRAGFTQMPTVDAWMPQLYYSHLVLADYLDTELPLSIAVSPEDTNRRKWAANRAAFLAGQFMPLQPDPSNPLNWRWMFSSSYELAPHFYSPDAVTATTPAIVQGTNYNQFQLNPATSGTGDPTAHVVPRPLTQVQFPSNKVLLSDTAQWTGARTAVYFMHDHARIPLVMVDGSASVRVRGTANSGFKPDTPTNAFWTSVGYDRSQSLAFWDPPELNVPAGGFRARWRFTRWGLRGRDFDGQEVTTP